MLYLLSIFAFRHFGFSVVAASLSAHEHSLLSDALRSTACTCQSDAEGEGHGSRKGEGRMTRRGAPEGGIDCKGVMKSIITVEFETTAALPLR